MSKVGFLFAGLIVAVWAAACSGESQVDAPMSKEAHAALGSIGAPLVDGVDTGATTSDAL
jgi:hypothetical protein